MADLCDPAPNRTTEQSDQNLRRGVRDDQASVPRSIIPTVAARLGAADVVRSAVDYGHVPFVVAFACGRGEVVQSFDLRGAQFELVGGSVLLDARDPLGSRNRGDVVTLREAFLV